MNIASKRFLWFDSKKLVVLWLFIFVYVVCIDCMLSKQVNVRSRIAIQLGSLLLCRIGFGLLVFRSGERLLGFVIPVILQDIGSLRVHKLRSNIAIVVRSLFDRQLRKAEQVGIDRIVLDQGVSSYGFGVYSFSVRLVIDGVVLLFGALIGILCLLNEAVQNGFTFI